MTFKGKGLLNNSSKDCEWATEHNQAQSKLQAMSKMKMMQTTRMLALKEVTENNEDESSDTSIKQIGAKKYD